MLPFGGVMKNGIEDGAHLIKGTVRAEGDLVPCGIGKGEVKALRPNAGKRSEHLQGRFRRARHAAARASPLTPRCGWRGNGGPKGNGAEERGQPANGLAAA